MTCPQHGIPLQCPACIGAKGGKVLSPKKLRALKQAAKRPRPGARKGITMKLTIGLLILCFACARRFPQVQYVPSDGYFIAPDVSAQQLEADSAACNDEANEARRQEYDR